jgi:hypothetical protein
LFMFKACGNRKQSAFEQMKTEIIKPWFFLLAFYKVWWNGLVECQGRNILFLFLFFIPTTSYSLSHFLSSQ